MAAAVAFWVAAALNVPGFGFYDEEGILAKLQFHVEGQPLPWGLFRFSFWHQLLAFAERLSPGNVLMLRFPALPLLVGEAWLLRDVVSRRLGERAGTWAALVDLLSAFSFIRSRSLLPWGATPFYALAILALMDRCRQRPWAMAACGASASAFLLEYEAWPMAGLWLTLESWRDPKGGSSGRWAWLAGAAAGASVVAVLTTEQWAVYLQSRVQLSSANDGQASLFGRLAHNLAAWVWPQPRVGFLGPDGHPVFPPWAWAGLALGAWAAARSWPQLLPAAAAALLPAISALTAEEPNRYISAWPPLCAMAGLGLAKVEGWGWKRAVLALALVGGSAEWLAGMASLRRAAQRSSAESLQWRSAARKLKAQAPPQGWDLISGLGRRDDAAFRFLCRYEGVPQSPQGRPVALLNWEYLPAVKAWGLRFDPRPVAGDERACSLVYPGPALAAALRRDASILAPLHFKLEYLRPPLALAEVLAVQRAEPHPSPLLRTALAEMDFMLSWQLQEGSPERVRTAVSGALVSADVPYWMAMKFEDADPGVAAVYAGLALRVDPRRREALDLLARLEARRKRLSLPAPALRQVEPAPPTSHLP